jgi:hypothetical protein
MAAFPPARHQRVQPNYPLSPSTDMQLYGLKACRPSPRRAFFFAEEKVRLRRVSVRDYEAEPSVFEVADFALWHVLASFRLEV